MFFNEFCNLHRGCDGGARAGKGLIAILLCYPALCLRAEHEVLQLAAPSAVVAQVDATQRDLKVSAFEIGRAEALSSQAGLLENPTISGGYQSDYLFGDEGESKWKLALSQKFPLSSRLEDERELSAVQVGTARTHHHLRTAEIRREAVGYWYDLVEQRLQIRQMEEELELLRELSRQLAEMVVAGEISGFYKSQVEMEIRALQNKVHFQSGEAELSARRFAVFLGLEDEMDIGVPSRLPMVETPLLAQTDPEAINALPKVQLAEIQVREAEVLNALARAAKRDDIEVTLEFESERGMEQTGSRRNNFMGVSVSVPLPFWNNQEGEIRERALARRQAVQAHENIRWQSRRLVSGLAARVESLARRLEHVENGLLEPARQQWEEYQQAHSRGEGTLLDVLQAHQSYLRTRHYHEGVTFELHKALSEYQSAVLQGPFAVR